MRPPDGLKELVEQFGDPRRYLLPDGTLSPAWERKHIRRISLPEPLVLDLLPGDDEPTVSMITCNVAITDILQETLTDLHKRGLWQQLGGYSGGFNFRKQRTGSKLSLHAWGLAWDFGASRDPLGDRPGGPDEDMPLAVVEVWEAHGFTWGGRWARADQMHFQWCRNY